MGTFRKQQQIIRLFKFRLGSEAQTICCYIDGEDSFRHVSWGQLALAKERIALRGTYSQ